MKASTLASLQRASGCSFEPDAAGGFHGASCPTFESKLRLLDELAWNDAKFDGRIRRLAMQIVRDGARTTEAEDVAPAIHAYVRDHVPYLGEGIETFQSAWDTLEYGGDCDDSVRAILALARAVGLRTSLVATRGAPGRQGHVCAKLWDGSALRWAEASIPANFGEAPTDALVRLRASGLVRARARTDLESLGELGSVESPALNSITARPILLRAWATVPKAPPATPAAVQAFQSICRFESGYGHWDGLLAGSNNMGATQCAKANPDGSCPAGSSPHGDTHADGTPYVGCFCRYATPEEGFAAVLSTLVRDGAASALGSGDAGKLARAMRAGGYFEADATTYARKLAENAQAIAAALGEPVALRLRSPWPAIVAVGVGAGALGSALYLSRRKATG